MIDFNKNNDLMAFQSLVKSQSSIAKWVAWHETFRFHIFKVPIFVFSVKVRALAQKSWSFSNLVQLPKLV